MLPRPSNVAAQLLEKKARQAKYTKCNPESLDLESPESPHTQIGLAKTVGMVIDMTSR